MKGIGHTTTLLLATAAMTIAYGCGSTTSRPAQAAFRPAPRPTPPTTWTKADKISAINAAPISPDAKKQEIAKVEAGQD